MSTWFTSGLKDLTDKVTAATGDLSEKVQAVLPIDKETLQKLTLSTPEMRAEREMFTQEYKHKLAVKDSLAHMYPWETRDPERDILVEECKEAIMALSHDPETFFGPYQMPHLNVKTEDDEEEKTEEEILLAEETAKTVKEIVDKDPSEDAVEKLAKLEPLPPRLANFDLIAHVGLIQKMLKIDPKLVERQSKLSGGGEREKVFWRNYFFHCAYTRYEAGLSIDEIWSDPPPPSTTSDVAVEKEAMNNKNGSKDEAGPEEVVDFLDSSKRKVEAADISASSQHGLSTSGGSGLFSEEGQAITTDSPTADYEMVENDNDDTGNDNDDDDDDDDGLDDAFGGEIDELEAEILRELED